MITRLVLTAIAAVLSSLLWFSQSFAGAEAFAPVYIQQTNKHVQRLIQAEDVLKSKPKEEWTDLEQQHYLSNAAWAVYSAIFTYSLLNDEIPEDLRRIADEGHLAVWPRNPYNDWKPMEVNVKGLSFSPGDLTLQLCPPSEYSFIDGGREVPLSFELGVFGPTENYARTYGHAEPNPENRSWANTPQGTLYLIGAWAEPASEVRKRAEAAKESREEANDGH